jgi:hypothetical protein
MHKKISPDVLIEVIINLMEYVQIEFNSDKCRLIIYNHTKEIILELDIPNP